MKHIIGISLLLLAAAASARAEDGTTFGFTDDALDCMPAAAAYGDLAGGALEIDGDTVRATIDVHVLPELLPGVAYLFLWSDGETDWYAAAVTAPTLAFYYGGWTGIDEGPSSMLEASGTYEPGAPGRVTIELPLSGLEGTTVLSAPRGIAAEIKGGAPVVGAVLPAFVDVDMGEGEGELRLAAPPGDTPLESAAVAASSDDGSATVPMGGAPIALVGLAIALLADGLWGRRR